MHEDLAPCPCGKPWPDFTIYPADMRDLIDALVAACGDTIVVTIGTRHWRVLRRCIAYHGIRGEDLLAGRSGHPEIH